MTPFVLLFGGAIITFALLSGSVGPGVTSSWLRWVWGVAGGIGWLALQGTLNGLRVRRARPRLQAMNQAASQYMNTYDRGTLERAARRASKPLLVQFWAESDLQSMRTAPLMAEVAVALQGRVTVGRVNVDKHPDAAAAHAIARLPTLLLFEGGEETLRLAGLMSPKRLRQALEAHL